MNDQDKKVLFEYLKSIQENVDRIQSELTDDKRELLNKYSELMLAVSKLITETHLLIDETKKTNKTVTKEISSAKDTVNESVTKIEENLEGKTRFIVRQGKKPFWKFWGK